LAYFAPHTGVICRIIVRKKKETRERCKKEHRREKRKTERRKER